MNGLVVPRRPRGCALLAYVKTALPAVALLLSANTAIAQISRPWDVELLGTNSAVKTPAIRGTDSAYDPTNNRYLVVGSCYGSNCSAGFGSVYGIFADSQGNPIGSLFSIGGGGAAHFPRVRYSSDLNNGAGGFMVVWAREGNGVRTRVVARNGTLIGTEHVISSTATESFMPWNEGAPALAYSPDSQRFLVAWSNNAIKVVARLVDLDGVGVGSIVNLSAGFKFGYYTGVTWNSSTNDFGVSFVAESSTTVYFAFARVPASTASAFTRQTFTPISGLGGATEVDYNPSSNRYIMAGWQGPSGSGIRIRAWEIDASGDLLTTGVISTSMVAYNAMGLARNPLSGTYLAANLLSSDAAVVRELNGRGFPEGSHLTAASGVATRYPRVSTSTDHARWNLSFADALTSFKDVVIATATTGGGSSTAHPAPGSGGSGGGTTTPPPPSGECTTPQPGPDWTCVNGGWLPPGMGGGGTTTPPPPPPGGCTTPQPGTGWTCVDGNWIPPSTGGSSCPTAKPGPDWVCVNGNWLPPGMVPGGGGSSGGGSGGGGTTTPPSSLPVCTSSAGAPGSGWVRLSNGNWVPPTHTLAITQGVCRAP